MLFNEGTSWNSAVAAAVQAAVRFCATDNAHKLKLNLRRGWSIDYLRPLYYLHPFTFRDS